MNRPYPLKFGPIPQERLWGGRRLAAMFGLDTDNPIGEIWTLSDHPSAPSICVNGELQSLSLHQIIERHPDLFLGDTPNPTDQKRFPLLIKFLHAADDLSVQIHPDDEYAWRIEGDYGKSEAWYILDAEPETKINFGHTFPDRETYFQAVRNRNVKNYLSYHPVQQGDFVYIPARTLHALLKDTMVLEIQQSSDVTYRVYDWDRIGRDGKSRELHIEQAAEVLTYGDMPKPEPTATALVDKPGFRHERLIRCPYFTIEKLTLAKGQQQRLTAGHAGNPDVLVMTDGQGQLLYDDGNGQQHLPFETGDTLLVPTAISSYELVSAQRMTVLRTFYEKSSRMR